MRILIVKTSSMGDVIHTLPALTDAGKAYPTIRFDWIVEESFAEIPAWHPFVNHIIPVAIRRWRKNIFSKKTRKEFFDFYRTLQHHGRYDVIIDAQGLLKSALLSQLAKGMRVGFDWQSAREPIASLCYQRKVRAPSAQHAIERLRMLFSDGLKYSIETSEIDYGLHRKQFILDEENNEEKHETPYLVFLHGTTWNTKLWPESYWLALSKMAVAEGYKIKLPWGNAEEKARAERIAASSPQIEILGRRTLTDMASVLSSAKGVVSMDTGLGHLAAALAVPTVSLYSSTDPVLTGTLGEAQVHLKAEFPCAPCFSRECFYRQAQLKKSHINPPCFESVDPAQVWKSLKSLAVL